MSDAPKLDADTIAWVADWRIAAEASEVKRPADYEYRKPLGPRREN